MGTLARVRTSSSSKHKMMWEGKECHKKNWKRCTKTPSSLTLDQKGKERERRKKKKKKKEEPSSTNRNIYNWGGV